RLRPGPADHLRSGSAAARAWFSAVYTRGDASVGDADAGHEGRYAAAGFALRARPVQALHAALQFSAVQRGRSEVPARAGTSRDWPRSVGGTGFGEFTS